MSESWSEEDVIEKDKSALKVTHKTEFGERWAIVVIGENGREDARRIAKSVIMDAENFLQINPEATCR